MTDEIDTFKYFMAAEKVSNMIHTIEQALEFFYEYSIKPDDEVKIVVRPIIESLKTWIEK
jgi:hypothetical protein